MGKHFILTDETKTLQNGVVLHRIKCTRDCKWAEEGEIGGWIENEENLSGEAWVAGESQVYGRAMVYGNARVNGFASVLDNSEVYGDTRVYGSAILCGNAKISSNDDYCCFQSFGSLGEPTTAFRQKDGSVLIWCESFRGSIECFLKYVEKNYGDSQYGREYKAISEVIRVKFGLH